MFGSKDRRIAELEALAVYLRRELDKARGTTETTANTQTGPDWERTAQQLAEDRVDAARADACEMARLNDIAEGWETLASQHHRRADRLTRAVVRCWAEIGRLRRQLAAVDVSVLTRQLREAQARIAALDEQLAVLQTANERHYRDLLDRPARIPRQFKAAS